MKTHLTRCLALANMCASLMCVAAVEPRTPRVPFQDKTRNLALGQPVALMPKPTYPLTMRGDTDATDLTDGKLAQHRLLRFDRGAVGWRNTTVVRALIDLGQPRDIGSVALHCQGGGAGQRYSLRAPRAIRLLVSDNGRDFAEAGAFMKADALAQGLIPAEAGKLYRWWFVVPANVRARYVMLSVQSQSYPTTMDEIAVLMADAGAKIDTPETYPLIGHDGSGATVYAHKDESVVPAEFFFYEHFGQFCGFKEATKATLEIDLPDWVEVGAVAANGVKYDFTRKNLSAGEKAPQLLLAGDRRLVRFAAAELTSKSTSRVRLKLFWRAPAGVDGRRGEVVFRYQWAGGRSETRQPVVVRTMPEIDRDDPNYQKLIVAHGRLYPGTIDEWPDFASSYRGLGFNTVILRQSAGDHAAKFRKAGLKIQLWLTPWRYGRRGLKITDYRCQYKGKPPKGKNAGTHCLAYRGVHFQNELKRAGAICARDKPAYVFFDFESWAWDGPECEPCVRCSALKKKLGIKTWPEYKVRMGHEWWAGLRGSIVEAVEKAGGTAPGFMFYDVAEVEPYQRVWDFAALHKEGLTYAAPSLYCAVDTGALKQLKAYLHEMGERIGYENITPWVCPGDCGEYDSANLEELLFWCYQQGMPGVQFWSERHWAADDVIAQARAIQRHLEACRAGAEK